MQDLRQELANVKKENQILKKANKQCTDELIELRNEVVDLHDKLDQKNNEIEHLSRNSSALIESQGLFDQKLNNLAQNLHQRFQLIEEILELNVQDPDESDDMESHLQQEANI